MIASINNALLGKLKPKDKPYEVRDDKIKGFLVRVNLSGKLLFMCEYARGKRVTIGKVGVVSTTQARDRALAILGDASKGLDPRKLKKKKIQITLAQFIDNEYSPWVREHRKAGQRTLDHIKRCFFKPFGHKPLAEITPVLVDQWRTQRLKDGRCIETVNRDLATFKAAISKAVLWGHIETHPLERLKLLKSDRSVKVRFLSVQEEMRLREASIARELRIKNERKNANIWREERKYNLLPNMNDYYFADHLRPMILLSINTGLRQGEVFSLDWENINFDRALLTIEGTLAKSGKTRHIPLNTEALHILKTWCMQSQTSGLVFPSRNGEVFNNVKRSWRGLLKLAKIENFRWHDLRHHFASRLVMAGVDLNTVRELLGHSDLSMTLRYAHLAPEHKANAVEKLVATTI